MVRVRMILVSNAEVRCECGCGYECVHAGMSCICARVECR